MRRISWRSILLTGLASAGLSNLGCVGGPFPFSDEWYADRAGDPPGARQIDSHGKYWPPYPRPVGRKQTFVHTYHYAHYWPYPHNIEDEAATRNIFDLQSGCGWLTATTLHDYHFNSDNQQLTEGGRNHLLWVANSVPAQYRTVYVAQGASRDVAEMRLANTEEFYRENCIPNPPPILARADVFVGRPAVEVDRLRQSELNSIPRQRLFFIGSATATSVGGTGAGGPGLGGGASAGAGTPNNNGQGSTTVR